MYPNAGASQRAQGRSPGLGGRGTHRRGVAPGAVASLCQPAAGGRGRAALTAPQHVWNLLGAEAGLHILSGMSGRLRRRVRMGLG